MEHAYYRDAALARLVEDQERLKPADLPLAQALQNLEAGGQCDAHPGRACYFFKTLLGIRQKSFRGLDTCMLRQVDIVLHQVPPRSGAFADLGHAHSWFLRLCNCARASRRIFSKSWCVSSLSSPSRPSSSKDSRRSWAFRFSSSRINSRM